MEFLCSRLRDELKQDGDSDSSSLYSFSSKPRTPGDRKVDLSVKFVATRRTNAPQTVYDLPVNSRFKLVQIRRHINKHFKSHFERGFIFLSKSKEISMADERKLTLFDILPKMPKIQQKHVIPSPQFRFEGIQYKKVCSRFRCFGNICYECLFEFFLVDRVLYIYVCDTTCTDCRRFYGCFKENNIITIFFTISNHNRKMKVF